MTVHRIVRSGHPVLARVADPIADPTAPEVRTLIADMLDSLAASGGIGLAAPQIAVPLRAVIYRVPEERVSTLPGDSPQPMTTLINPVLTVADPTEQVGWEGCLSMPGLAGQVPRARAVRLTAWDLDGRPIDRVIAGYHARVLQHECDHLDGVLYVRRMTDMASLVFTEELRQQEAADGA